MQQRVVRRLLERLLCPTIGCTSPFSRRWEWPHAQVCSRVVGR
jgi:hypothetical protein